MQNSLLIVSGFVVLCYSVALPSCCFEVAKYEEMLSSFPCNFTCDLNQKPLLDNCISCMGNTQEVRNKDSKSLTLLKPVIACQDRYHKPVNKGQRLWVRAVLTWSPPDVFKPSLFLIKVKEAHLDKWHFIGITNTTAAVVENLSYNLKYKFQITPLVIPSLVLPPSTSEWILLSVENSVKSFNLTATNFRFEENSIQITVEWTIPKDAPCSFLLYWWPTNQYLSVSQKIITMPDDYLPVILSGLLFETNYSMKLEAIYQSDIQKVAATEIWFVTPSCLTLTRRNFSLCAPGPPLNVSVSWINDSRALVSWLPPNHVSSKNQVSGYHLSVNEVSKNNHVILRYKESFTVGEDILNAIISDLRSAVSYMLEVRATSNGGVGPPVVVELDIKEPKEIFSSSSYIPWYYVIPSSVIVISAILIAVCINLFRMQRRPYHGFPSGTADIPNDLLPHLLPSKNIDFCDVIGKGEFGVVHRGVYCHGKDKEIVAVKIFPAEGASRSKLLHEVSMLHKIGRHENIVGLIGFTFDFDKISLVLEYCALGNLHAELCKLKRKLVVIKKQLSDPKQPLIKSHTGRGFGIRLSSYIHQIALGMEYISSLKLIHRDLAARNILLCNETHVKIGDFGLAENVSENETYSITTKQKRLPVRWMAPESLEKHIFTTYSDVWSFGVLMWEIFKFGKVPYSTLSNSAILLCLKNGHRLPKPICSQYLYDLMLECWHMNPYKRPSFKELVVKTESNLSKLSQYTVVING